MFKNHMVELITFMVILAKKYIVQLIKNSAYAYVCVSEREGERMKVKTEGGG